MKRKVVNEKVIRAMAIGISAMLATATPMTVMAAEGEGDPEGGNSNEAEQTTNSEAGVCDAAQKAADAAQESAGTVKTDVETNVSAGEVKDSEGKDLAQEVINAAEKVENKTIEDGAPLADAETDITNTKIQLDTAKANDGGIDHDDSEGPAAHLRCRHHRLQMHRFQQPRRCGMLREALVSHQLSTAQLV